MTRGKQIIEEAKRIIAEAHERGNNDPMVDLAITLSFTLGARWADSHPHWISVEEELPKIGKDVLVLREDGEMQVAHQYNEEIARWWSVDGFPLKNNITHWMPLPQAPKEGD